MKNFIDFIVDAAKDSEFANEFHKVLEKANYKEVSSWLKDKGYNVHEDECKKLMDNKEEVSASKLGLVY
ncbi:MAG: hypothetical protein JXR64_04480 [Spirochaetales bacterium]|nr:hypothetical protein [Spirochaetales bacterium]